MPKFHIKFCPTCGGAKVKPVVSDVTRNRKYERYNVPTLEFYLCADCGEKIYTHEAMLKIQEESPAYQKEKLLVVV
jgi:ribosomal protein L32